MHKFRSLRVFVLAALLSGLQTASAQRIPATLDGRNLEIGLLRLDNRTLIEWPDSGTRLTKESIIAGSEFNLAATLAANGIEPDVGAYSLFYELNPAITKASTITAASTLVLPKIVPGAKVQPLLAAGQYLVVLFLDSDVRGEIANASAGLQTLAAQFDKLPAGRFRSTQEQTTVEGEVHDLAQWYDHVSVTGRQRKGPPLNRETLDELRDEAKALAATMASCLQGQGTIRPEDRDQISAIHQDMEREIRRYDDVLSGIAPDPDLVACCRVVVRIQGNPAVVGQLRVYYTLNGLFRNPPPGPVPGSVAFTELGSDKSKTLRAKNYMFWAVREGAPNVLVTQPVMAPLDPGSDQPTKVDLMLMPQFQTSASKARGGTSK